MRVKIPHLRMVGTVALVLVVVGVAVFFRAKTDAPTLQARADGRSVLATSAPSLDSLPGQPLDGSPLPPVLGSAVSGRPSLSAKPGSPTSKTSVPGTSSAPAHTATPGCPNPKTCPSYTFANAGAKGWKPDADGIVRIHYWINPKPPVGGDLTADQVEAAIRASAATWEAADPRIKFVYDGRTTREPVGGDGHNDFAYGNVSGPGTVDKDGYIVEADIARTPAAKASWDPCEQRDGSCTATGKDRKDAGWLLSHEIGHALGLGHVIDDSARCLTMYDGYCTYTDQLGGREKVTLGLGDVLGLRALYPCNCPMPPIYDP